MNRLLTFQICLVVAGMLAWAWFGLGSIVIWTGIIIAVVWVGLPLLAFSILFALCRLRHDGLQALRMTGWVAGIICLLLGAQTLGEGFCKWEVRKARSYVSQALPAIENFHSSHGRYPDSLDELKLSCRTPRLFKYSRYESGSFGLYHSEPSAMMGGWKYDPGSKEWKNLDWD